MKNLRSQQMYSDLFAPWVNHNLGPAVQSYLHQKGVAGHHHSQRFFYMCPTSAASASNLKASYASLIESAEVHAGEARKTTGPL